MKKILLTLLVLGFTQSALSFSNNQIEKIKKNLLKGRDVQTMALKEGESLAPTRYAKIKISIYRNEVVATGENASGYNTVVTRIATQDSQIPIYDCLSVGPDNCNTTPNFFSFEDNYNNKNTKVSLLGVVTIVDYNNVFDGFSGAAKLAFTMLGFSENENSWGAASIPTALAGSNDINAKSILGYIGANLPIVLCSDSKLSSKRTCNTTMPVYYTAAYSIED